MPILVLAREDALTVITSIKLATAAASAYPARTTAEPGLCMYVASLWHAL